VRWENIRLIQYAKFDELLCVRPCRSSRNRSPRGYFLVGLPSWRLGHENKNACHVFNGGLHPHSGIATLTYVVEGTVSYIDPDKVKAHCNAGWTFDKR
jgi:hypothetical protein